MTRGNIRPGGRTERVRQVVAATVLQLIKDGENDFTMTDVCERSGIARSTIYARWPSRDALLAEALRAHNSNFRVEQRDDWREYLGHVAMSFRDFAAHPDEIAINALTATLGAGFWTEETHRQWRSISEEMAAPLRAAQAVGAIREGVDTTTVIATLFTSITGLIVIAKDVPTDAYLCQLVELLVSGCAARP